jgi:hypothetical protein
MVMCLCRISCINTKGTDLHIVTVTPERTLFSLGNGRCACACVVSVMVIIYNILYQLYQGDCVVYRVYCAVRVSVYVYV